MKRRLPLAVTGALLVLALAGCSGSPATPTAGPSLGWPQPKGVQDPAQIPSAAAADTSCDPLASYRPHGSQPTGATVQRIRDRGRLIIGVDQTTYLFGYRDGATGQIVGFDVDIAREMARAILGDPDKVQLVAITSAQRIPYLRDKKVDIVAHTMTINCDRWKQIYFSTEYYHAGQRVLVSTSSPAKSIDDLGGKKVCAAAGSTSITNIANATSKPIPVAVADWTDCLVMLQQNQVDAISTDDTILAGLAAQDPNVKLVGGTFTNEPYGLGMAPDDQDFVRTVNAVLERMRTDGTWARIYTRWLGGTASAPPAKYRD
jgi:polar amino acid transport system substrate-binding protein